MTAREAGILWDPNVNDARRTAKCAPVPPAARDAEEDTP
jgi:hypothetical protein